MHTIISSTLIAANVLLPALAYQPLNPLQQLAVRNPYYGGYALPQPSLGCPAGLETCEDSFCCPLGTWCGPSTNGAYCCPTEEDCFTQVNDLPTCADPSWTLFQDVYPWCCTGNDIGIGGQVCSSPDVSYSAEDYAATETQANTASPPATRAGASAAATSDAAGSTNTGGAQTSKATSTTASSGPSPTATGKTSAGFMNKSWGVGGLMVIAAVVGWM